MRSSPTRRSSAPLTFCPRYCKEFPTPAGWGICAPPGAAHHRHSVQGITKNSGGRGNSRSAAVHAAEEVIADRRRGLRRRIRHRGVRLQRRSAPRQRSRRAVPRRRRSARRQRIHRGVPRRSCRRGGRWAVRPRRSRRAGGRRRACRRQRIHRGGLRRRSLPVSRPLRALGRVGGQGRGPGRSPCRGRTPGRGAAGGVWAAGAGRYRRAGRRSWARTSRCSSAAGGSPPWPAAQSPPARG